MVTDVRRVSECTGAFNDIIAKSTIGYQGFYLYNGWHTGTDYIDVWDISEVSEVDDVKDMIDVSDIKVELSLKH